MTKFLLVLLFGVLLQANSINAIAKSVSLKGSDKIILKDDVAIFYENYTLFSDLVEADKSKKSLSLKNGVSVLSDELSIYAKEIAMCEEEVKFKEMFAIESSSKTWIKTTKASQKDNKYFLEDLVVSSCDIKNPTWKLYVKKGSYDTNNSFLTLRNSYLVLGGLKVMYIPYITIPLNKKRKSGLLRPQFGISNTDGFLYFQPIFVNLAKNYDLEITPQYRSKRGVGIFSTFRFVDTNNSKGFIRGGYFKNKSSYVSKNSLLHDTHQGVEFYYKNKNVSGFESFTDKLFIDYKILNDIDYINTQSKKSNYLTDKLVTSKLNYIAYDENNYFGAYLKYFKDTSKTSNDDTLQILPSFQYHRFENTIFKDNILYSLDLKTTNFYRKSGLNASEVEFNLPFVYTKSLFKDYVNFSLSQNLLLNEVRYKKQTLTNDRARFMRSYFKLDFASDLVKQYSNVLHSMHFNLGFIIPNYKKQAGVFEDFVKLNNQEKSLSVEAIQFFYKDGENFFTHRLNQTLYYERDNVEGDLINEIELDLLNVDFTNKVTYSYIFDKFTQVQNTIKYQNNNFKIDLLHTYSSSPLEIKSNFLSLKMEKEIDEIYKVFSNIEYDYENRFFKSAKLGVKMQKRCLKYNIYYKYELTPDASQSGTLKENGVYFDFELTPLGSLRYYYSKTKEGLGIDEE